MKSNSLYTQRKKFELHKKMGKNLSKAKRLAITLIVSSGLAAGFAIPVFAATPTNPGLYGTAAPNAQCGTAAGSGAFNAQNSVYGPNSRIFGQSGGAGGGQVGINNSTVCGRR